LLYYNAFVGPCLNQAIAGPSSSQLLQKSVSTNLSESLLHEPGEFPLHHLQVPLFEELCVSLRRLLARDCTRPIISSPEPVESDEDTTSPVDTKPSLKSGDYMETFYEIQVRFGSDSRPRFFFFHLRSSEHVELQSGFS